MCFFFKCPQKQKARRFGAVPRNTTGPRQITAVPGRVARTRVAESLRNSLPARSAATHYSKLPETCFYGSFESG